jgi:hypothetical protein
MKRITIGSGIGLAAAVAATLLLATPAQAYTYSALGGTVHHNGGAWAAYDHGSRRHSIGIGSSRGVITSPQVAAGKRVELTINSPVYGPFTYLPGVH